MTKKILCSEKKIQQTSWKMKLKKISESRTNDQRDG